ncbi:Hint domain-containing protein [Actibacterium sp. MT2.3-13A]|uniref:Hint domain-containing protein n=1 Tax=Actibacterium sp. MT2.3-13A TaxID=2828332 RepID=UPI001BA63E40|nr:Hint domain-containing protein [Actibacterium sp. MT2.3-13A]
MKTGFRGAFVIPWAHTEVDGLVGAPVETLVVGSTWRWSGEAVRVDGPPDLLLLDGAEGVANLRKRAARSVRRMVGAALYSAQTPEASLDDPLLDRGFVVTDGLNSYTVTEIGTGPGHAPLLMFVNSVPPAGTDLWVVRRIAEAPPVNLSTDLAPGVICFAAGTRIATPEGPRPVEDLGEGDLIQTRDDGVQEILWTGRKRITGARLYAMPHLRPIRIRAGALGGDALGLGIPDGDLIVSPQHRLLIRGRAAEALFQTPEVLVAAEDLVNGRSIAVDHGLREVTYVHLMLERHQVVWANGVEAESFHPANTALDTISPAQRERLLNRLPALADDPHAYGDFARRNLSAPEAEILQHELGLRH